MGTSLTATFRNAAAFGLFYVRPREACFQRRGPRFRFLVVLIKEVSRDGQSTRSGKPEANEDMFLWRVASTTMIEANDWQGVDMCRISLSSKDVYPRP
jgi:hypothetical protein